MNQSELIAKVAAVAGMKRNDVEHVLKIAADVVTATLAEGEAVVLPGLGKLHVKAKAAREGRNPSTGEAMQIPAKRVPHFLASKALKDVVTSAKGQG